MIPQQAMSERDLLYTDGYISQMLGTMNSGTMEAALYFTRLLRFDERLLRLFFSRELGTFFITHPTVQLAPPSNTIDERPAWLLDYIIRNYGTVVPQRLWIPATAGDAERFKNVSNMPIFFVRNDCKTLGLRLLQAGADNCAGLLNARVPAPMGPPHTTCIRVKWPGYDEQSSQIMIRDQTPAHNLIPLEVLAARVARVVSRFLDIFAGQSSRNPDWRVGGWGGITANDVILIGLIQVTQGSWQPILQLSRFIVPRS